MNKRLTSINPLTLDDQNAKASTLQGGAKRFGVLHLAIARRVRALKDGSAG